VPFRGCAFVGTASISEAPVWPNSPYDTPDGADEPRPSVDTGRFAVPQMSGGADGRGLVEPGWRRSEHVEPVAGTDSFQSSHVTHCVSGRIAVRIDDGIEMEIRPGDVVVIPPRSRRVDRPA
jgi:hypothetical protein